jgi:hypothetical protein
VADPSSLSSQEHAPECHGSVERSDGDEKGYIRRLLASLDAG